MVGDARYDNYQRDGQGGWKKAGTYSRRGVPLSNFTSKPNWYDRTMYSSRSSTHQGNNYR